MSNKPESPWLNFFLSSTALGTGNLFPGYRLVTVFRSTHPAGCLRFLDRWPSIELCHATLLPAPC